VIVGSANIAFRAQLVVPAQRQLYDYWIEKARGRPMPERRDIHPAHFPRLLPNISLIDIDPLDGACRVRLAGTRLRDVYDREITGLVIEDLDLGDKRDYWTAAYQRTVEEGKPSQGVVRGPRVNKEHLVQYWLKLPLCRDGATGVGMILCFDHFQSAAEDEMTLPKARA
jgi:PAS domain